MKVKSYSELLFYGMMVFTKALKYSSFDKSKEAIKTRKRAFNLGEIINRLSKDIIAK